MKRGNKAKAIAVLVCFLAFAVLLGYYAATVIVATGKGSEDSLKLGLDLAGGVSITYGVDGDTPTAEQMSDTINKLQKRIENDLGAETKTTEASVYQVGDDRIAVEIPGVSDANAILEELGTPGDLYFIKHLDSEGKENYTMDQESGEYVLAEGKTIESLTKDGSIVLTGADVASADGVYETDQTTNANNPVVSLTLNDSGTQAFADATLEAFNNNRDSIGIYYDGHFVSVPSVSAHIQDGRAIINGMESIEEAQKLASYIRIGGLDIKLVELESQVVGATLGSDALKTSFIAAAIGLGIVALFMIIAYLFPGFSAVLALAMYTELIIGILKAFDITLTLPGIAGIILSIGMAVDANVIIFARIKEEIAAGKDVRSAIDSGFAKALSAIVDGNITTLIVAAVLGILGSGTVKGFAITLAIGVILSMFTALVITRLLLNAFYSLGVKSPSAYGKNLTLKTIDFVGKSKIFGTISAIIIIVGIVTMGIGAAGGKALNYSLEFSGGTSTTVGFNEDYSIEQIESDIVPVVSEITGDNDIQTQKVNDGNGVVIKTRTLNLEEREALNTALNEKFGVEEDAISSQNISSTISGEMRSQAIIAVIVAVFFVLLYIWFRFKDLRFGGSAVIALVHDVLVTLTFYAVLKLSVGSAFIACILTIIGYSINDTIVVFDRIRENLHALRKQDEESLKKLVNESITATLTRSLSTSFTTAVTVLMLLVFGVSSIREFALPLLVGVLVGTYSSIFIASPLWWLAKKKIKSKETGVQSNRAKGAPKKVKADKDNQGLIV
ncbi:MAG: protein translocase subunit SecD [Lachnospiraceae bacterium]|nr:protein translocase subunit SecD [Lachnospiraceae bacterium]